MTKPRQKKGRAPAETPDAGRQNSKTLPLGSKLTSDAQGDVEVDFTRDPLKDKIGTSLKRYYNDVVNEPVPDEFLSLLANADQSTAD